MQPQYDWQKGQDAWEAVEVQGGRVQDPPLQGRLWIALAVVLILGLIGGSVFLFLNRRARTNTAAVEADILATHSLIFQAISTGDAELLQSNMSGRDPGWAGTQTYSVLNGLIYDRVVWGLRFQPSTLDDSQIKIVLNPEWDSAELVVPLDYIYSSSDEVTETVRFEQTLVYRRSRERWLLAPADVDFWGEQVLFEGRYLTLDYPARDRGIVERLAADLDEMVGEVCGTVEVCKHGFRVTVPLYKSSPDIGAITSPTRLLPCISGEFTLPTPTLVGLPVDEAGYEALLQGYQLEISAIALAEMIYGPDCANSRLKIAALDYRLRELGLRGWPLTAEDYAKLWAEQVHLEQMFYFIERDGDEALRFERDAAAWRPYYALIEFLATVYDISLDEIGAYVDSDQTTHNFYWETLHGWIDGGGEVTANGSLEEAWEQFLREKAGIVDDRLELPEQNLRLVCDGGSLGGGSFLGGALLELDLGEEEWTAVDNLAYPNGYLLSLPGDEGVVVMEQRLGLGRKSARGLLWEEGQPVVLFETAENLLPVSIVGDEGILVYAPQKGEYGAIWLELCLNGLSCGRSTFSGFPLWSPSMERFLSLNAIGEPGYERQIFGAFGLRQLAAFSDIPSGQSPFWLSDDRFGFVAEDGRTVRDIAIDEDGNSGEAAVLFTLEEVAPLLALDEAATIEAVLSRPEEPEDLIVTVKDREGWASIYQVNILRRWIQPLQERAFWLDSDLVYNFDFSPEMRWLVVSGSDSTTSIAYLHLLDLDENVVHSFDYWMDFERPMHWAMDWSAGDGWLALPDNGYVRLIHPAADYQDVIVPEGVGCLGAVWVNNNE